MKNTLVSFGICILLIAGGNNINAQIRCGTDEYVKQQTALNPNYKLGLDNARDLARQWLKDHPTSKKSGAVLTIPVVFHVLYENASENISDAQIYSQVDVLNEDYRKLNADTTNIPSVFTSIAADCEIEFCLAVRDPNGNSTTGITRTATTVTDFSSAGANPKYDDSGGKNAWPRSDYLNFWVCDIGSGLLGYATPPGGAASDDGVVCLYTSIGRPPDNPFGGSYNKGRTGTHEIGHWLGLGHTFNGGCAGTTSSTCGIQGDYICDTPPTATSNYGCPSMNQNSCTETPTDQNDMTMNYMDYVDDGCMNLFTNDQSAVMRSVLNSSRASLQSSLSCTALNALDAGVTLIQPIDTFCGISEFIPQVTLTNYGSTVLTYVAINYQIDGGSISTYNWNGSLGINQTETVALPAVSTDYGTHSFNAWSLSPNGGTDELATNDTTTSNFEFTLGNSVTLTLAIDAFPLAHLISWEIITDSTGAIVDSSIGYAENSTNIETICLSAGCYTLTIDKPLSGSASGSITFVDVSNDTLFSMNEIKDTTHSFCVTTTGIIENELYNTAFNVFPNPTSGLLHIRPIGLVNSHFKVNIYNIVGALVQQAENSTGSDELIIDVSNQPVGIYIVELITEKGRALKKVGLTK